MTLGCTIGFLAQMRRRRERDEEDAYDRVRADFEAINRTLRQLALPVHHEPEDVEDSSFDLGLPNCLHGLRRLAAYLDRTANCRRPGSQDPRATRFSTPTAPARGTSPAGSST